MIVIQIKKIERIEIKPGIFRIDIHLPNGIIFHFGSLQKIKDFADKLIERVKSTQLKIWKFLQALRDSGINSQNYQTYIDKNITVTDLEIL